MNLLRRLFLRFVYPFMYIADLNTVTYDGMICFILQINHLLAFVTERDRPFNMKEYPLDNHLLQKTDYFLNVASTGCCRMRVPTRVSKRNRDGYLCTG